MKQTFQSLQPEWLSMKSKKMKVNFKVKDKEEKRIEVDNKRKMCRQTFLILL